MNFHCSKEDNNYNTLIRKVTIILIINTHNEIYSLDKLILTYYPESILQYIKTLDGKEGKFLETGMLKIICEHSNMSNMKNFIANINIMKPDYTDSAKNLMDQIFNLDRYSKFNILNNKNISDILKDKLNQLVQVINTIEKKNDLTNVVTQLKNYFNLLTIITKEDLQYFHDQLLSYQNQINNEHGKCQKIYDNLSKLKFLGEKALISLNREMLKLLKISDQIGLVIETFKNVINDKYKIKDEIEFLQEFDDYKVKDIECRDNNKYKDQIIASILNTSNEKSQELDDSEQLQNLQDLQQIETVNSNIDKKSSVLHELQETLDETDHS